MKMYNKPISVISLMDTEGNITPIKWKIETDTHEVLAYSILNILQRNSRRIAGKMTCNILCETEINGAKRPCELRYILDSAQWLLYKL